ncbi:MAG TPA: Mth938-like domain-containing protein [Burkholderiales bacterium]|nr:Mth938-like domain-containing protein [Burkholderiales bacterium]
MKFHLTHAEGLNLFTGYGDGYVLINRERYNGPSLLVTPDRIEIDWKINGFNELQPHHFNVMLEYTPELVILGTGQRLRFPHPRLSAELANAGIGLEIMDTKAACRTFNILVAEGRRVVLGLLLTDD